MAILAGALGLVLPLQAPLAPPAPAPEAPGPEAAAPGADEFAPFVFIHAGDTELGSPDLKGTTERFALLAQRANVIGPAFVIIAGDLTHDSSAEQLKAFNDVLKQFKLPVKFIRGNHDKADFYKKNFGPDHYVFTWRNCDFVCLNSEESLSRSSSQWRWLEGALKDARERQRTHVIAVIHHPFGGGDPLGPLLVKYGVRVVLCGHEHKTKQMQRKGYVMYVTPGTAKWRDDKGLAYRVFKVYKDRIEQELVPLEKEGQRAEL